MIYVCLPQRTTFQKIITGYLWVTSFISCLNKKEIADNWFSILLEDGEQMSSSQKGIRRVWCKGQHLFLFLLLLFKALLKNSGWINGLCLLFPPPVKSPSSSTKNEMHKFLPTVKTEEVDIRNPEWKIGGL